MSGGDASPRVLHPLARRSLTRLINPVRLVEKPPLEDAPPRIFLDANENAYGGPFCRYPEVDPAAVRTLYTSYLDRETEQRGGGRTPWLTSDYVWLTAGSAEGIDLVIRAFGEAGDTLCTTSPAFPMYEHWARAYDLSVIDFPLQGERRNQLLVERIVAAQPKITFLTSPHNPYGAPLDPGEVLGLLERLRGIVAIDEAYLEVSTDPSFARLIARFPNLIVLRSFSKAWGLAGLRLGAIIAVPSAIEAVCRLASAYLVSTPALETLHLVLGDTAPIEASWQRLREERERVAQRLAQLRAVKRVHPSCTHFLLIELHDVAACVRALAHAGILIKPLDPRAGTARITISRVEENDQLLEVLGRL
jgi:histidinol-phosphate aminotransferase